MGSFERQLSHYISQKQTVRGQPHTSPSTALQQGTLCALISVTGSQADGLKVNLR